jgi:ABC-type antimicrobial peptide transport system permease subunit
LFSIVFGVFSVMAWLLALVGLFSAVLFSVAQKTSEFGVRMALGASRVHIPWKAVRVGFFSAAIGISLGALVDYASSES